MRAEFLFKKEVQGKDEYFTMAATWMDSIRNGVKLEDGSCLKEVLTVAEQQELMEYIMEQLMPEIKTVVRFKKRRTSLDEYKAEELESILSMMVYEDFHKYNKAEHLADQQKRYTISAYLEHKARESMREMLIQERSLPVNVIRNLKYVNVAILSIAEEQEISCDEVTAEMVYEKMSDKSISYKMVLSLMELYHGNISIEEMENPDERLQNNMDNPENKISNEINENTKKVLDQVFMDFSKMELYIVMKEFGFLGEQIRSMTAKEISYKDYFVSMTREDRDGEKNIVFGNVHVKHPGRNTAADEIFVESVYYVKEKFYSSKVAKIKKKLVGLAQKISMAEVEGCLEAYCMELWKEKYCI